MFSKDETKTEATPLLRLNIPRHSAVQGSPDSGPLSPRYSPDPSSLVQSISFHRSRGENRDSSSTGASIYRLPEKLQEPSPPPPTTDSSGYLQPVTSPADGPAYLELEYESTGGRKTRSRFKPEAAGVQPLAPTQHRPPTKSTKR